MRKTMHWLVLMMAIAPLVHGLEISKDGQQAVDVTHMPSPETAITDVVPLPNAPNYSCNLRMQVGGMDFGDFDNDDDLDLAVGCYHSQSYPPYNDWRNFVLTNNNGQLEPSPSWFSTDSRSTCDVKWADFNGDEYLDLYAANGDFTLDPDVIYFGSANGLSNTPAWLSNDQSWTISAAICDFDHDGDIDVATANEGVYPNYYRPVYIYYNNGQGLTTTPSWQSSDVAISNFISWGDVNGDGWQDLAVAKWVNFQTCVYPNIQGSMQTSPNWAISASYSDAGIGLADVDNDSFPEAAVGGTEPTRLYDNIDGVLGTTPIWQSNNAYHGCQDLAWGDIDGDGDPDLATVEFSTGEVRVYLNADGVLESRPSWTYRASGVGTALVFGDVNGDGYLDLAMGQSGQPCVMVFLNTGPVSAHEIPAKPEPFALKQNHPNPFNASTKIEFEIVAAGHVVLDIYDILGKKVRALVDADLRSGPHSVVWDASEAPSGLYYYALKTGNGIEAKRMTLIK